MIAFYKLESRLKNPISQRKYLCFLRSSINYYTNNILALTKNLQSAISKSVTEYIVSVYLMSLIYTIFYKNSNSSSLTLGPTETVYKIALQQIKIFVFAIENVCSVTPQHF